MIRASRDGDVAVIEIDRHERRNALDADHCDVLRNAVREQAGGGARAVVITGAGSSFCSGADLGTVYDGAFRGALYSMLTAITDASVPVIAAVNGPAIGAGTQLALACDLRVAAPAAAFAIPAARLGVAVDPWTIRRLTLLAGGGTAQAIMIGCATLDAAQALRCGLASRPGDRAAALACARELAALAPLTLAYSKRVLNQPHESADDGELIKAFDACWASDDRSEGQRARAEKRPPRFQGR
ncbi:MAG TPA: enoyl-CoA hydratase [Streptosporangiaceae bacterium]|nr:enoyl-CoA hydratase [Streptosporangiaceae bacterium]